MESTEVIRDLFERSGALRAEPLSSVEGAEVETIVELLAVRALAFPNRTFMTFPGTRGRPDVSVGYSELNDRARGMARALLSRGISPGSTVAIVLAPTTDFLVAYFGVLCAGMTPAPLYPPTGLDGLPSYVERHSRILRDLGVSAVLTNSPVTEAVGLVVRSAGTATPVWELAELARSGASRSDNLPVVRAAQPGLIQYTSGSTRAPRGVVLSHRALLANCRAIGRRTRMGPGDRVISWLPLYHDMGLIGMVLCPLFNGLEAWTISPLEFLRRPASWLELITRCGATLSAAPAFGFSLCTSRVSDAELRNLSLSSWRVAFNGAEPIQVRSLEAFNARFAAAGLRPGVVIPTYGLAEATLAVTLPDADDPVRCAVIDRALFESEGVAAPVTGQDGHDRALRHVCVGRPIDGCRVSIVDADTGIPLPEGRQGEIRVDTPCAMSEYFGKPDETAEALADGWLRTGDLGYLLDGQLFVTGRKKDLIIRRGRKYHPQDLEEAVWTVPGVRTGCVVAFALPSTATEPERVIVAAEVQEDRLQPDFETAALQAIHNEAGFRPDAVVKLPKGTLPKTGSGKLRRATARELYMSGALHMQAPVTALQRGALLFKLGRERLALRVHRALSWFIPKKRAG